MSFLDQFTDYSTTLDLFKKGVRLPEVKITEQQKLDIGLKKEAANVEYLKKLSWLGCQERIKLGKIKQGKQVCIDRLKVEFDVFEKTGTIDYILLLMDVFLWCEKNDIVRGVARGSSAASLALYCLGLNYINPLDFDLDFTRFLSEARVKPKIIDGVLYGDGKNLADFDGDVSYTGREKLLKRMEVDYLGKTCKILTLQTLTGKMAMKECVKIFLEYSEQEALTIGGYFEAVFGKMDQVEDAYKKNKEFKKWVDSEPRHKECYDIALQIQNLHKAGGVHASGIVCSYAPVADILPLEMSSNEDLVSGMSMKEVLSVAVKCDVLGLRTLDQVDIACREAKITLLDIDIHDESIYKYLRESHLFYGIFQLEDGLTKQATIKVKPRTFEHIMAIVSISRPGSYKEIDRLVQYVNTGERKLIHPEIDKILENTGSILIYQEQITAICQKVYGMMAIEADNARRMIGKKLTDEMKLWEPVLFAAGIKNNVPDDVTKWFWQTCKDSADYLFNQGHCGSYSYLTAYTVFLKANYPLQFFLGCLKMAQHEADPITCYNKIQSEMRDMGLKLFPPNIIKSERDYAIKDGAILAGLSSIRGVAGKGLEKLSVYDRANANIFDIFEHFEQAKLSLSIITPLILSGTLNDDSKTERSKLLLHYELYSLLTPKEKLLVKKLGTTYQFDLVQIVAALNQDLKDEKGKQCIKDSRRATIKRDFTSFWEKYQRNMRFSELSDWIFEQTYIGYSFSATLQQIYEPIIDNLLNIKQLSSLPNEKKGVMVGIIRELDKKVSKKGTPYLKVTVADDFGSITAMIFMQDRIDSMNKQNGGELKEGDIVCCHVMKKDGESYFADNIVKQECPVVLKKSTIEKENKQKVTQNE